MWKVDCSIMELIYVGITNISFAERVRMPSVNKIIDVRLPCMAGCGQDTRLLGSIKERSEAPDCEGVGKVRGTRQSGCEW